MIDRPTIERIKDAADIVDVVSEFVSLKKVGANYRGLCPFHNDHSPSFYVSPSRRTCHCFVCGEGGDSVGFIMKHEQMTYPDALKWLANRYHIEIQERQLTDEQRKEQDDRESMFVVNEWAAGYFKDILHNDIDGRAIGMQYFRQRGIRDDIIEKFRLGFCLSQRSAMSDAALAKGFKGEYLKRVGLSYPKGNGDNAQKNGQEELLDRFSGRAIFPWVNVSGKVVAFGGRVLDARTKGVNQKYVNSPDSDIYHKERELYGIFQAKKAIAKENLVYMVEGYTDVISMHQCGLENVVANSGTALSEYQINMLHRFTTNIVLLYDGDAAGIKAALRGTGMLLKEGMNVKIMLLPDGKDPDEFAKTHTADEFREYIKQNQMDFITFMIKVKLEGVTDAHDRSEGVAEIVQMISLIGDPITRASYIQDCASRLGYSEQTLTQRMNEEIKNYREEQRKAEARRQREQENDSRNYSKPSTGQWVQGGQTVQGVQGVQGVQTAQTSQTPQTTQTSQPSQPEPSASANAPEIDDPYYGYLPPEAFSSYPGDGQASSGQTSNGQSPIQPSSGQYGGGNAQGQYGSSPQGQYSGSAQGQYGGGYANRQPQTKVIRENISDLLMKMVIQHGSDVVLDNVESEDGSLISLNVAQYIDYSLAQDSMQFSIPIYNTILAEAVEQSAAHSSAQTSEQDTEQSSAQAFDSEAYFTRHPDYDISSLALRLTDDISIPAQSESEAATKVKYSKEHLLDKVEHLLLDFRYEYIDARLKQLRAEITTASPERQLELMAEMQQAQKLRTAIAKKIGSCLR